MLSPSLAGVGGLCSRGGCLDIGIGRATRARYRGKILQEPSWTSWMMQFVRRELQTSLLYSEKSHMCTVEPPIRDILYKCHFLMH